MARSNEEEPKVYLAECALGALVGSGVMGVGMLSQQNNEELKSLIAARKQSAADELFQKTGQKVPDLQTPEIVSARRTIASFQEPLGTMYPCQEVEANSNLDELVRACSVLEGPKKLIAEYNKGLMSRGVPKIEQQLTNDLINDGIVVLGGGTSLILGSIVIGYSVEKAFRSIRTKLARL